MAVAVIEARRLARRCQRGLAGLGLDGNYGNAYVRESMSRTNQEVVMAVTASDLRQDIYRLLDGKYSEFPSAGAVPLVLL